MYARSGPQSRICGGLCCSQLCRAATTAPAPDARIRSRPYIHAADAPWTVQTCDERDHAGGDERIALQDAKRTRLQVLYVLQVEPERHQPGASEEDGEVDQTWVDAGDDTRAVNRLIQNS